MKFKKFIQNLLIPNPFKGGVLSDKELEIYYQQKLDVNGIIYNVDTSKPKLTYIEMHNLLKEYRIRMKTKEYYDFEYYDIDFFKYELENDIEFNKKFGTVNSKLDIITGDNKITKTF